MIVVDETHLLYLLSTRIDHLSSLESTGRNVTEKAIQQRFLYRYCDVIDDVIDNKFFENFLKVISCRKQSTTGQHDEKKRSYLGYKV